MESFIAVHGPSRCSAWAQQLQREGLVALQNVRFQLPNQGLWVGFEGKILPSWITYYITLGQMPLPGTKFLGWSHINNHRLDILNMLPD